MAPSPLPFQGSGHPKLHDQGLKLVLYHFRIAGGLEQRIWPAMAGRCQTWARSGPRPGPERGHDLGRDLGQATTQARLGPRSGARLGPARGHDLGQTQATTWDRPGRDQGQTRAMTRATTWATTQAKLVFCVRHSSQTSCLEIGLRPYGGA